MTMAKSCLQKTLGHLVVDSPANGMVEVTDG
jgi:hypothetical protein